MEIAFYLFIAGVVIAAFCICALRVSSKRAIEDDSVDTPIKEKLALRTDSYEIKKAFYINTDSTTKRRIHMESLCSRLGLNSERVKPVDVSDEDVLRRPCEVSDIHNKKIATMLRKRRSTLKENGITFEQLKAEISLSLTHKLVLEKIADASTSPSTWYIVFEDDADLGVSQGDLHYYFKQLINLETEGFAYLGICIRGPLQDSCTGIADKTRCHGYCTHAYICNSDGAARILRTLHCWMHPVDMLFQLLPRSSVLGMNIIHDQNSEWHGPFFQNREAEWYQSSIPYQTSENNLAPN